jgi:hypothetical protein
VRPSFTQSIGMLERETDTIIQILAERTIGSARSLALKDVIAADLPAGIARYLQCDISRGLRDDLAVAPHFAQFKFSHPLVHQLTAEYTRTISLEYIFTREEFLRLLENAVHFVENYVCRPQWTLDQFLFEKNDRITIAGFQDRFAFTTEYTYFGTLVEGYLRQKGLRDISRQECALLLRRIDDSVVQRHNANELAWLARPIFEFLLLQKDIAYKHIPIKPLIVFFEDKHLDATAEYIERMCRLRGKQELTIDQLALLIEDFKSGKGETIFPAKTSPEATAPRYDSHVKPVPPPIEDEPASIPVASVPSPREEERPIAPAADKRNIALSLTFSGMTDTPIVKQARPQGGIRQSITEAQYIRFLSTLFQHDDQNFRVVIDTLGSMTSWDDASLYLHAYFQTRGVDPLHSDAIEFTELLQHWYSSGDPNEIH